VRGGSFNIGSADLRSTGGNGNNPTLSVPHVGFRVAMIPEPSSLILAALGIVGIALTMKPCRGR
jgi:PEP-CTERM motif